MKKLFAWLALVVAFAWISGPVTAQKSKSAARPRYVGTVTSEIDDPNYGAPNLAANLRVRIVANAVFEWNDALKLYEPTGTWTFDYRLILKDMTTTASASGAITPKDGAITVQASSGSLWSYNGAGRSYAEVPQIRTRKGKRIPDPYPLTREIPWWGEGNDGGSGILPPDGSIEGTKTMYSHWGMMQVHWHFTGELPGLELLVVDPQSFDTWRPEAGLNEATIGNEIKIDAKLQGPDGGAAKVKARKIIFELTDTSREPGVALNFPLAAANPGDFDLQFSPKSNPPGRFTISGTGNQRAETVPGKYTSASVTVSSFDWGAWSTLKVTAELEDGRRITGHLKSKSGPTDILLPKRSKDSKIADIWKEQAGVTTLPDDDDSETGPAGDSSPGDGFSLYEEYRGFYVHGEHISGDPKKIDFFVRNDIGVDAEPGIFLFADLTGAEVHSRLLDTEFDRQSRVMNANRDQGPHRDPQAAGSFEQYQGQHGVLLQTQAGLDGGLTHLSQAGVRGRPAIVMSANLQPRDSLTGMTTSENVPYSDLAFAYDRAVAHELLHTVGAEHHGEGDGTATFYYHYGDDPQNATGKPYFSFSRLLAGETIFGMTPLPGVLDPMTIIDEATGRDRASMIEGDTMLERERERPNLYPGLLTAARKYLADRQGYNIPWTAEQLAEHDLDSLVSDQFALSLYVGAEHGESSGNELCVMRYYFAKLYKKKGTENAFYYVTDSRTEHTGLELCRSSLGTGINDKNRTPQPRYGDAAATRGACTASIIFNDALPLISDAIPQQKEPKP
jgi:hypothetical protein